MKPVRPCLECGTPTKGTRCPAHEAARQRARNAARTQYAGAYVAFRRRVLATATHCALCGRVLVRSSTSPAGATYDHEHDQIECRSCNSGHRRNA